jgi:hypothetical protein
MPCVNAMTMVGERVPAGTGKTSAATQKDKTTPPSKKIDHRFVGSYLRDDDKTGAAYAATGIADVPAAPLPK